MFDEHIHPEHWGVMPYLKLGALSIPMYELCVGLGIVVGLLIWWLLKEPTHQKNGGVVILAALIGGAIGAKLPIVIMALPYVLKTGDWASLLAGRTITGGLIGALIGVMLVKKLYKIEGRFGNPIAIGAAFGCAIGRLGCFFRGCCYGVPTTLPWGVNFGDGCLRQPTQIYESLFFLVMGILMLIFRKRAKPGQLMVVFVGSYFTLRFFEEFIRDPAVAPVVFGLTVFQWICLVGLAFLAVRERVRKGHTLGADLGNELF
jgi:prolipoprotein diacylglyceryltransferase